MATDGEELSALVPLVAEAVAVAEFAPNQKSSKLLDSPVAVNVATPAVENVSGASSEQRSYPGFIPSTAAILAARA